MRTQFNRILLTLPETCPIRVVVNKAYSFFHTLDKKGVMFIDRTDLICVLASLATLVALYIILT
jgi:hypothetical protein